MENSIKRISEDLKKLATFGGNEGGGVTRLPFTKEARACVDYLKKLMTDAGMTVREDVAGNVFGVLEGEDNNAPAIMMGSHYDTVLNGGAYDGIAGVVCAIETARLIKDSGTLLKSPFIAVAFNDEEGLRFSQSYLGSQSMLGNITLQHIKNTKDRDGISIYEAIKEYGNNPEDILNDKIDANKVKAFFELHIEQGPVLDSTGVNLGLVDCIVGIQRFMVTINGRADHAGTTPMDMRIDANEVATKVISLLPDCARSQGDGSVATVGYMKVLPGGMNIVPETVEFGAEFRSRNTESIANMKDLLFASLEKETAKVNATFTIEETQNSKPTYLSEKLLAVLEEECKSAGCSYKRMLSGAGHDAQMTAKSIESVMVFVPSKNGRSHSPAEHSEYSDLARATSVIYKAITKL